ncbi:hypothetical protein AMJ57_03645 [Parcubacteria bacterium SG8_24]|nr:MAG: hypothetical protein AMJ57_03645 [Parcubacteria bacterium SG8_24]
MEENRETFFARIQPLLAPSDLLDIELAYTLAKYAHRWQVRLETDAAGRPRRYFEHLRRVALILIDEMKVVDPTLIIAALNHDGIEDTRDLTPELLEHCFGTEVTRIVKGLSKVPKEGYIGRLMMSDWKTLLVKACDRLDNLRSLDRPEISAAFRRKQLDETQRDYLQIFDRLVGLVPPDLERGVRQLRDGIKSLLQELDQGTAVP